MARRVIRALRARWVLRVIVALRALLALRARGVRLACGTTVMVP